MYFNKKKIQDLLSIILMQMTSLRAGEWEWLLGNIKQFSVELVC